MDNTTQNTLIFSKDCDLCEFLNLRRWKKFACYLLRKLSVRRYIIVIQPQGLNLFICWMHSEVKLVTQEQQLAVVVWTKCFSSWIIFYSFKSMLLNYTMQPFRESIMVCLGYQDKQGDSFLKSIYIMIHKHFMLNKTWISYDIEMIHQGFKN